jgi:hypothetical protein
MKYSIEMASGEIIYLPRFIKIGTDVQAISRFCLRNLRSCNVGITDGMVMMYAVEMASCGMICLLSFMMICTGIQAIIRFYIINLRGCNVGIPCRRNLRYAP